MIAFVIVRWADGFIDVPGWGFVFLLGYVIYKKVL